MLQSKFLQDALWPARQRLRSRLGVTTVSFCPPSETALPLLVLGVAQRGFSPSSASNHMRERSLSTKNLLAPTDGSVRDIGHLAPKLRLHSMSLTMRAVRPTHLLASANNPRRCADSLGVPHDPFGRSAAGFLHLKTERFPPGFGQRSSGVRSHRPVRTSPAELTSNVLGDSGVFAQTNHFPHRTAVGMAKLLLDQRIVIRPPVKTEKSLPPTSKGFPSLLWQF